MPASVHLTDWPEAGEGSNELLRRMQHVRDVVSEGLDQRAQAGIKVRQPLQRVSINPGTGLGDLHDLEDVIKDELNVKEVTSTDSESLVELDTNITPELKREGLARDVIRQVQQYRKQSGLNVDDRISLSLVTESDELARAIEEHVELIREETLAAEVHTSGDTEHTVQIEGAELGMTVHTSTG